ncbi:hypothetical protein BDY19DRAFT_240010 [Irpex rosettiformis]|uniref:Uncharacterized protein n=1 Tax=Irpex rosettiformis TaxID=378272 RepID=A0ACB8U020_9APHY|nr:hypothetical protein BDY19DRAFT_240010 [Irpex rosettiformis]
MRSFDEDFGSPVRNQYQSKFLICGGNSQVLDPTRIRNGSTVLLRNESVVFAVESTPPGALIPTPKYLYSDGNTARRTFVSGGIVTTDRITASGINLLHHIKRANEWSCVATILLVPRMDASFETFVGPFTVLMCFTFLLYGIYIAQLYYYYLTFKQDGLPLKSYVFTLGIVETVHVVLCILFIYEYFVRKFGDAENGIDRVYWSFRASIYLEIISVFMAQALYCWRIWRVSHRAIILTAVPALLSFTRFCLGWASMVLWTPLDRWALVSDHPGVKASLTATYAIELASDSTISGVLIWCLLRRGTSPSQFAHTNDVIQKLVYYILNTAAANMICSIAVIITLQTLPGLTFVGIAEMRTKVYGNIMMALLNARTIIFANRDTSIELPVIRSDQVHKTPVRIYTTSNTTVMHDDASNENNDSEDSKPPKLTKHISITP